MNIKKTARRFVVHENTLRAWIKAVEGKGRPSLLSGAVVWNRMDDAVRYAAHELRSLFPQKEFGTRTIARHLVRAGIQLSRSTVQRVLRQPKPPRKPKPAMEQPVGVQPHDLLKPKKPNHVWHSDITQIRVLWVRFHIAAILDGFSRKLLALKVYTKTPCARNTAALVKRAAAKCGTPKFIITDNGSQFRRQFGQAMRRQRIGHVRTRVRAPFLDGKCERFFRTFKLWARLVLFGWSVRRIQRRLDGFKDWYNGSRPHSALGVRTPDEAFTGHAPPAAAKLSGVGPTPVAYRARDGPKVEIEVCRRHFRGDAYLAVPQITIRRAA